MASVARLVVRVQHGLTDCFARVHPSVVADSFAPAFYGAAPLCCPVEVRCGGAEPVYVGALADPQAPKASLVLSGVFAASLGLDDAAAVTARAVRGVTNAVKVFVEPATVDDCEVVEQNQQAIEATLLQHLRVVAPGQRVPISVHSVRCHISFGAVEPAPRVGCALLGDGTELYVAVKSRDNGPRAASGVVGVTTAAGGEGFSLELPTVVLPSALAAERGWVDGDTVGMLVLAVAARATYSKHKERAEAKDAAPASVQECSVEAPSMLRSAQRAFVRCANVAQAQVHGGGFQCPTRVYLFTPVPAQVPAKAPAATPSLCDVTMDALSAVHTKAAVAQIVDALRPSAAGSCGSAVLVVGGRGQGKSTIVRAACAEAGRRVHHVQCSSDTAATVAALAEALPVASLCGPSAVVLDDIDAAFAHDEQQPHPVRGSRHATELARLLALVRMDLGDVAVVATAKGRENVAGALLSTPELFGSCVKLPALGAEQRAAMLGQALPRLPEADRDLLAAQTENFTPFDFMQLARKAAARSPDAEGLADAVRAVLKTFRPLAHSGVHLHKAQETQTWAAMGGLQEAKKALCDAIVLPSKYPHIFGALPLKARSGVLLYGPPGCGKTYVVSLLAAVEQLNCIVVNGPEILDKYIGASEQKVREVFEKAQAAAPCVLFFDEFDSIAPQRGHDNTGVTDRVVNQLLCYLDGVEGRKNVYVVAASSRPDMIDAALLRPGRLDRAVLCGVPDQAARLEILEAHSRGFTVGSSVDWASVAARCEHWSAADLAGMLSTAHLRAAQRCSPTDTAALLAGTAGATATVASHPSLRLHPRTKDEAVPAALCDRVAHPRNPFITKGAAAASAAAETGAPVVPAIVLETVDIDAAIASMRPSLSPADLALHQRIAAQMQGGPRNVAPGSVTSMA